MMKDEGWDCGQDDEELFELAMHERQYRDYKSGVAKERFNNELEELKAKAGVPIIVTRPVVEMPEFDIDSLCKQYPGSTPLQTPSRGKILWQIDVVDESKAPAVGTKVKAGKVCGYVQTPYGMEEIVAAVDGRLVAVTAAQGKDVVKNEIVALIK